MKTVDDFMDLVYTSVVRSTFLSDGKTPWFMAEHPQLPGCLSDGPTEADALQNLEDARIEYIASLIKDGIDVPIPLQGAAHGSTETSSIANSTCTSHALTSIRMRQPVSLVAD